VVRKNTAPVIISLPSVLNVNENTLSVYQINAVDVQKDALSYSLSGENASEFNLSAGGLISFKTLKDFENIANNKFKISVTVSDGVFSESRDVFVMVIDVQENQLGESNLGSLILE